MPFRRRAPSLPQSSFFDHLMLWGGLALLFTAVALIVGEVNSCVGVDVKAHSIYSFVPGLELGNLPSPAREQLVVQLNRRVCTCGCLMTLASCRNNHVSCRTSKTNGQALIDAALLSAHLRIQSSRGAP